MIEDWLGRWSEGRTGWHEQEGNVELRKHWPNLDAGSRVLVPLCGKSYDLLWLANQGYAVSGVELSPKALEAFFAENDIGFDQFGTETMMEYRARDRDISLYCGDFFDFESLPFDALYDRGALVALPPELRSAYISHVNHLLAQDAACLLITLEYDQSVVDGPPYSVMPGEMQRLWPGLMRISECEDIHNAPPKFRAAGLQRMAEVVWSSN